jgi:hypothetical protein
VKETIRSRRVRRKRGLRKQCSKLITHTKRLEPRIGKTPTISCCWFCLPFTITSSRDYLAQYFLQLLLQDDLLGRTSLASKA